MSKSLALWSAVRRFFSTNKRSKPCEGDKEKNKREVLNETKASNEKLTDEEMMGMLPGSIIKNGVVLHYRGKLKIQ